jgi:hypothetical protein
MKDIAQTIEDKKPNTMNMILTYDWIFSSVWEKLLLVAMCGLAMYGVWRLIF